MQIDITKPATEIVEELIELFTENSHTKYCNFNEYEYSCEIKNAIIAVEIALLTTPEIIFNDWGVGELNLDYTKWQEVLKILKSK